MTTEPDKAINPKPSDDDTKTPDSNPKTSASNPATLASNSATSDSAQPANDTSGTPNSDAMIPSSYALMKALAELRDEIKRKPSPVASWLLPATISAGVAVIAAILTNLFLGPKDHLEHVRAISKTQGEIIRLCSKPAENSSGVLLFRFELEPLYVKFNDIPSFWKGSNLINEYKLFSAMMISCRQAANDQGRSKPTDPTPSPQTADLPAKALNSPPQTQVTSTEPSPAGDLSAANIQKEFNSPNRLRFSDQLVARYSSRSADFAKALVVSVLPNEDPRSYRVNLYVALTLARLTNGWPKASDPDNVIEKLRATNNYRDPTFSRRVEEAIDNRI